MPHKTCRAIPIEVTEPKYTPTFEWSFGRGFRMAVEMILTNPACKVLVGAGCCDDEVRDLLRKQLEKGFPSPADVLLGFDRKDLPK